MSKKQSDFYLSYFDLVISFIIDISSEINKGGTLYKKHLESLNHLLSTGKTHKPTISEINNFLVNKLESVPPAHSLMKIYVEAAPDALENLTNSLRLKLNDAKTQGIKNDTPEYIKFRNEFKTLLTEGLRALFFETGPIVRISSEETAASPQILEEYVRNYMGQNKPVKDPIYFSDEAIIKYYQHIEYKICTRLQEEESLLNESLKVVINNTTKNLVEKIDLLDIEFLESEIINVLSFHFSWLNSEKMNSELLEERLLEFKEKVRKKIITLSERANAEVFPTLLETKIAESKEKYQKTILEISGLISSLDKKREDLIVELKGEGLYEYGDFVHLEDIENYADALREKNKISSDQEAVVLRDFVKKRQEKSKIVKEQLSNGKNTSYEGIKGQIESLESVPEEEADEIIQYFIFSVKLFAVELEKTILGDLEATFSEIQDRVDPISRSYDQKLFQVRSKEKDLERQAHQDKINALLGAMTHYELPQSVADKIFASFSLDDDNEVSTFLKSYTDESFVEAVAQRLSSLTLEELVDANRSQDLFNELSVGITDLRVKSAQNYVRAFKDVVKDLISNESLISTVSSAANIVAPGIGIGFEALMGILDAREKNQENLAEFLDKVKENMRTAIVTIGSKMIKDKFEEALQTRK